MSEGPRRVLAAVDGSVASLKAGRLAIALAATWGAAVRLIAVADEPDTAGPGPGEGRSGSGLEERRTQLRNVLEYVRREHDDVQVVVDVVLRERPGAQPYELILEEAERWRADLLVVGRRGHRGLGRALLGSQAEHVLEFAGLPVVVVPEKTDRQGTQWAAAGKGPLRQPRSVG
jgi:nucleotide-binding universal stress UspA family protein